MKKIYPYILFAIAGAFIEFAAGQNIGVTLFIFCVIGKIIYDLN